MSSSGPSAHQALTFKQLQCEVKPTSQTKRALTEGVIKNMFRVKLLSAVTK